MTRQELIEQAALNYGYNNPNSYWDDDEFVNDYKTPSIDFMAGAEWADKTMLDKVCKWLEEHLLLDDPKWYVEGEKTLQEKMINDLRKAMEE